MAISTLQLSIAAEKAVQAASAAIAPLKYFATSFNAAEANIGNKVRVPVFSIGSAAAFNAASNNYAGNSQDVAGVDVTLDDHYVKSVYYTDLDFAECDVNFFAEAGIGIAKVLSRAAVDHTVGLINKTNCENESVITAANFGTKSNVADLYAVADSEGLDPRECVMLLKPAAFAKLLGTLDANVYGGTEAVRDGLIPGLFGFKAVVSCNSLSTDSGEKLNGAIVHEESIGIAGRYLRPDEAAYSETGAKTDEKTGLTIGFRRFADPKTGYRYIAGELLYGDALLQPTKVVRLVESATA